MTQTQKKSSWFEIFKPKNKIAAKVQERSEPVEELFDKANAELEDIGGEFEDSLPQSVETLRQRFEELATAGFADAETLQTTTTEARELGESAISLGYHDVGVILRSLQTLLHSVNVDDMPDQTEKLVMLHLSALKRLGDGDIEVKNSPEGQLVSGELQKAVEKLTA